LGIATNRYKVQFTKRSQDIIQKLIEQTNKEEYVHNVYELPSIEQTVQYLHAAAGYHTEKTWLKAIGKGNYNLWPLVDTTNVGTYFPKSEETQFGHMRGQCQGVPSTHAIHPAQNDSDSGKFEKKHNIFIHI
jgi:hypothetical protein